MVVVLAAGHAGAATVVFRLEGPEVGALFGTAVVGIGDVDGDGVPDLAVGAPQTLGPGGGYLDGRVFVYSGATSTLLYELNPLRHRGFFGARLASVGDLDGDGIPEIAMGTPYGSGSGPYGGGVVTVRSGSDGTLLDEFDGSASGDYLGRAIAGMGDLDGDGVPDLLLAAPNASPGGRAEAGLVQVRSGATGEILRQLNGAEASAYFGQAVANVGDLDGDGVDDFAVAAPSASPSGMQDAGSVFVYSGASGQLLYRWDGPESFGAFGSAVAGGGDVDGDGVPDVIVGAPGSSPGGVPVAGSAFVFSGATGALLFRWDGAERDGTLGQSVAILGDLTGDGRAEVAIGAPTQSPGGRTGAGAAVVLSYY